MSDWFDQLLELLNPDRLLRDPRATGAGVSVAVIDSGIDRETIVAKHPNAPAIAGCVFINPPQPLPSREGIKPPFLSPPSQGGIGEGFLPYTGKASAPHGTTVADVILTVAPQASLFSADVFGPQGGSDAETVI